MNNPTLEALEAELATTEASKRRRGPQGERGPSGGEAFSELIEAPMKAAKKKLSGDEGIWYGRPDWMPHEVWAATQVAGDILGDPLNLVGAGIWGKGARAARGLYAGRGGTKEASKGMLTASADNYIDNFYVPDDTKDLSAAQGFVRRGVEHLQENPQGLATKALNKLSPDVAQKVLSLAPENIHGASQRGGSLLSTLMAGAKATAKDIASPTTRALFREHGVSGEGQRIIQRNLKKGAHRGPDKAGAEAIYQGHQIIQAGGEVPEGPLKDFLTKAFLEWYQPNTKGTIKELTQKHAPSHATGPNKGKQAAISDADAQFLEDNINTTWGSPDTVVMKRAESVESGKHLFDLFGARNPNMSVYKQAMKNEPKTNDELYAALKEATKKNKMAEKYGVTVMRGPDGGVWLSSSRPGSAIVEGGYRGYHKVEPNGDVMAMMSDEHDFLEKAPVLGKVVSQINKKRLLAISPPIKKNIFAKGDSAYKQSGAYDRKTAVKGETMKNDLEKIANLKPSKQAVQAERERTAGMLSSLAASTTNPYEETP